MNILVVIGLVVLAGLLGGKVFERAGVPHVVGFIVVGILLGDSGLRLLPAGLLDTLSPLTTIALAFIGFMVGGELQYSVFRRHGRRFFATLFAEGLLAMGAVFALVFLWTGDPALALLLGALSSATAPAATVDVIWEYRARGPLSSTILAIVALDDGLSLFLYGFALAVSEIIVAGAAPGAATLLQPIVKIAGAAVLGLALAAAVDRTMVHIRKEDNRLILATGAVTLSAGAAGALDLSFIMTAMFMGLFLANVHRERNEGIFTSIRLFAPPVYLIFFVFVGARMRVGLLPAMGMLGLLYVGGRTAGKWLGAWLGGTMTGAPKAVRRYLGLALFSQAGVAVGLSLDIQRHFSTFGARGADLGNLVVNIIAATTFLVQIIGPPSVKLALSRAGEIRQEGWSRKKSST